MALQHGDDSGFMTVRDGRRLGTAGNLSGLWESLGPVGVPVHSGRMSLRKATRAADRAGRLSSALPWIGLSRRRDQDSASGTRGDPCPPRRWDLDRTSPPDPGAAHDTQARRVHAQPAVYERQRRRFSTWGVPRFLQSFDETLDGGLICLAGCVTR